MGITDWMYDEKLKRWTYTAGPGSVQAVVNVRSAYNAYYDGRWLGTFPDEREALWAVEKHVQDLQRAAEIQALERLGGA